MMLKLHLYYEQIKINFVKSAFSKTLEKKNNPTTSWSTWQNFIYLYM